MAHTTAGLKTGISSRVSAPALPEKLEYRLLSHALIIRDVRANIIVDFILDVF